jgi:uncharacterized protein (TIGR00255 family)
MTGYGKHEFTFRNQVYCLEIKTLNAKNLDLNLRLPNVMRALDFKLKSQTLQPLYRGKIDILVKSMSEDIEEIKIDEARFMNYYSYFQELSARVNNSSNVFKLAIQYSEKNQGQEEDLNAEEVQELLGHFNQGIALVEEHRKIEGLTIEKDIMALVDEIQEGYEQIKKLDTNRIEQKRQKIKAKLDEIALEHKFDLNSARIEEELIYYIDKLDIHEEIQRMFTHIDFFRNCILKEEKQGKKLGFITQEMLREINTTGSKANDSDILKIVVQLKNALEQIKEQIANIL